MVCVLFFKVLSSYNGWTSSIWVYLCSGRPVNLRVGVRGVMHLENRDFILVLLLCREENLKFKAQRVEWCDKIVYVRFFARLMHHSVKHSFSFYIQHSHNSSKKEEAEEEESEKRKGSDGCHRNNQNGGTASLLNINSSLKDPCGAFHWFVLVGCVQRMIELCWSGVSSSSSITLIFWHGGVEDGCGLDHYPS